MMNVHRAEFVLSAAAPGQFVKDGRPQFVFAGRSNVGKSSVLNRLLMRKNLARVGETPGKTRCVNFFLIDGAVWFVDLPGYGYAKVAKREKQRWGELMEAFFADERQITAGFLLVDARHTPTADDKTMAAFFQQTCVPFAVIANKVDKLKASQVEERLSDIRTTLVLDPGVGLFPFSARTGQGREDVIQYISHCLEGEHP